MSGSTISGTISHTVTFGTGAYTSPLTITSTGDITPSTTAAIGLVMPSSVSGSVINFGTITGGLDTNNLFSGGVGVQISAGTFINDGHVAGGASFASTDPGGDGVNIYGGLFDNTARGTVAGGVATHGYAVDLAGGTFINAGMVIAGGGSGEAIVFNGGGAGGVGTLVIDPGSSIVGSVVASTSVADLLEFGAGGSVGTVTGIGSQYQNFSHFSFATGASFDVSGTYTAFDAQQTIAGFAVGDTLTLDGFTEKSATYVSGTGLELTGSAGSTAATITLDVTGAFSTANFQITPNGANTAISLNPCFAQGTRILTARGEIPVEQLAPGDHVVLHDGTSAPITWIGHRSVAITAHPTPEKIQPVLIISGALGHGLPTRDLYVSPDHALFFEDHLIPAKCLINGVTIRQIPRERITYYHVELAQHAVLLAEGAPAESYLETGNRSAFANGDEPVRLHPDFARSLRAAGSCAPLVESGPVVEAVRARLLTLFTAATTDDPALTTQTRPDGSLLIASRNTIPGHRNPDPRDQRQLGVKIARITRADGTILPLDHPALTTGWHDLEADGRWTNGQAIIPAALLGGQAVTLTLAATLAYPAAQNSAPHQRSLQRG
ncbi:hypothetical protein ACOSOMT5_P2782 [Acidiphilium sp. MT5]